MNQANCYLMLFICLVVLLACPDLGEANRAITIDDKGSKTALVIGNADYKSAPLKNPVNDARDMAVLLRNLEFDVIEKTNADKRSMVKAVNKFGRKLHKSEVGVFFFAGHGMQIDGRNFLIPVQANVESESDVEFEAMHAGRILGKMEEAENKLNIVILDACRNNPFERSFRTKKQGLAQMDAPIGSIIAYATSPGEVAADGSGRNGVYTKHLLQNLKKTDLSVQDVFMQTGLKVMQETSRKQVPWTSSTPVKKYYLAGGSAVIDEPKERQEQDQGKQPSTGTLKVGTEPKGAVITINNISRGPAPVSLSGMNPGSYRVRAEKEGYESQKKRVRVRAGRTATVRLYLEEMQKMGRLYVHPTPEDARVKIMNIGLNYHEGIELEPGKYKIRVDKQGYEEVDRVERLRAGEDLDVYVDLEHTESSRSVEVWADEVTQDIRIGWTAWSDAEVLTKMTKYILEEIGCNVQLVMSDIGIQYQAIAKKNIDIMLMAWLPKTHKNYWKKYSNRVDDVGIIYTNACLGWVVPDYVPESLVSSIDDLNKSEVRRRIDHIQGIDPGAGLMQASENAISEYGLDETGYRLLSSSGAGMTAALSRAIRNNEWIVVTGWRPHWKFAKWNLRILDDPKHMLGGIESIHAVARKDFKDIYPVELYNFFKRMHIPIHELEEIMLEAKESSYQQAAIDYVKNHSKRVNYWLTGKR